MINNKNKNKGSALLISLLILSTLFSSILYINIFSMRQITKAKNIDNSIIAFYAAESANEQAIYQIRKNDSLDVDTLTGSMLIGGAASVTRQVTGEVTGVFTSLEKNMFYQFDIFDPNEVNLGSGLDHLSISWNDDCGRASWLELTANEWTPQISGFIWGSGSDVEHVKKSLLNLGDINLGDISSIGGVNFSPLKAYQFRIKALYCNISNLRITAYDNSGVLPFKNVYNISSLAEYPRNTRGANRQALSVSLKRASPLSGLFDYVIFSEKALIKDSGLPSGASYPEDFYIAEPDSLIIPLNINYNHEILIVNGVPPYTCSVLGDLPTGILLSSSLCKFSGTANASGAYAVTVSASYLGYTATKNMYLIVR